MRLFRGCLLLMIALPAHAAEPDDSQKKNDPAAQEAASLRWLRADSAATCPSEADVTQAIERRLGAGALVSQALASLLVEVALTRAERGFHAEITLRRGDETVGKRELESDDASCLGIAETAALVIALAIDPRASLEPLPLVATAPRSTPVDTPATAPAPPPTSRVALAAPPPSEAVAKPPRAWQGELEVALGIATGSVPNAAGGLHARGRALPPALPFGLELEGAYFPGQRLEAAPRKGADFSVFYAGVGLCSRPARTSRLGPLLCVGSQVGAISGQGYGYVDTPRFRTWTFALGARAAVAFRVRPPFAVMIGPWLSIPLKRDHFETTTAASTEELFRPSRVGLGFDLGGVWEL